MKRILAFSMLAAVICMSLCSCRKAETGSKCAFANVQWIRSTEADTEYIRFSDDGGFSYYCGCGNPVNNSDLCEGYSYDAETKTITLHYEEKPAHTVTKIRVITYSDQELVLDFDGDKRTFTKEVPADDWVAADTVTYRGDTYILLEYNMDIFYYDLNKGVRYEEDTVCPIAHDKWDAVYFNGDVFIRDTMVEEAASYYADDANYMWSIVVDEEDFESTVAYPLSLSTEELAYIYEMEDMEKEETLFFDDIEKFATLTKTSGDGFVSATVQLARFQGFWYWRSERIDENQEGWPEYVIKLPASLNEQLRIITESK